MCGIAGIFDLLDDRDVDPVRLKKMADALAHRGPDGEGFFRQPGIGLAHRRLAIIDRIGGHQPINAANGAQLTFNGEIYNYRDLAAAMTSAGARFRTRSDSEVLAEGLAREGKNFLSKLRGMFAVGFYDPQSKELLLARDRIGERPLYYATTADGWLVFASEIGAVIASGLVGREMDERALADYFLYGFIPDPKSVFRQIRKLPPATTLSASRGGGIDIATYWSPEFQADYALPFERAAEELVDLLDDAVQTQLVADVPVGAFLSGGVDSSAIVAAMARTGGRVRTSTVGFLEDQFDERPHALRIAQLFKTDHSERVAGLDIIDLIDAVARAYGEPFADASALPTYVVSKITRERVTVALSGDGGDEVFAGYRRYPWFVNEERVRTIAPALMRRAVGAVGAAYPKLDWAPRPLRLKTTMQSLAKPRPIAYAHAIAANRPERMSRLMSADFRRALNGYQPESVIEEAMQGRREAPLLAAQRADFAVWLPGRMLTKVDRASMAHGLEVRPPLLDPSIVEWAGRLPPEYKLQAGAGKRVLKAALSERLPHDLLHRKKQGFGLPLAQWMREPHGPLMRLADSGLWRTCGILDAKAVDDMAASHRSGAFDCGQELWTVVMFDAFLRSFGP